MLREFQIFKLSSPLDSVPNRQLDVVRNSLLDLCDRTAEIATAHAKLHRNVAARALVIDVGCSGVEAHRCEVVKWDVGIRAGAGLVADIDVADPLKTRAILWCETYRKIEGTIALEYLRCGPAAHRGLNPRIDVAGLETVAPRPPTIDPDVQVRLAEHVEYA